MKIWGYGNMTFDILFDQKLAEVKDGMYVVRISSKLYNGLSMDEHGLLKVTKGPRGRDGVGGTMNTPGNGLAGTVNQGTQILRMNSTVTRLATNDPYQEDGGKSILDIALHILGRDQI